MRALARRVSTSAAPRRGWTRLDEAGRGWGGARTSAASPARPGQWAQSRSARAPPPSQADPRGGGGRGGGGRGGGGR
eukprot:CAMPEP_0183331594 /NCGR_PEP_ID=MMETSP0164_2-20130417/932_1 /TAXON_ID=221442 /ORGANISM="Coccolithus pelagicus ssp braarudi, Strain PLY182g" /LENGTH=76 /DNA_ID=CAMNT_0025500113 /DNA_START=173 /DNA_END=400 /DNA_ORIENTATION=+